MAKMFSSARLGWMTTLAILAAGAFTAAGPMPRAAAQCQLLTRTLSGGSTPDFDSSEGYSVAISESYLLAGDLRINGAYLYDVATGTLLKTFRTSSNSGGWSVAISGNNVLVGAPYEGAGAVSHFDAASGALLHTFTAPESFTKFGASVAISGTNVLIGAPGKSTEPIGGGTAYLYDAASGALLRKFDDPTPATEDRFGGAVAVAGNYVAVGAAGEDREFSDAGSVYVFDAETGSLLRGLTIPADETDERFGHALSISGNNLLVGAPHSYPSDEGKAYLFDLVTGALLRTFNGTDYTNEYNFGLSVAISGNNVLAGHLPQTNRGANVYMIDAQTAALRWTSHFSVNAHSMSVAISGDNAIAGVPDGHNNPVGGTYLLDASTGAVRRVFAHAASVSHEFAESVAISGTKILVGSPHDVLAGYADDTGSAYVFDTWTSASLQVQTLSNPRPDAGDLFGSSVALSADYALVGAAFDDFGTTDSGAAYLFDPATGALLETFNNPDPALSDQFGKALGVSGNNVLIGAPNDDMGSADSGIAYLFDAATGSLLRAINNPEPGEGDAFGASVAISGSDVVVGAVGDSVGANHGGRAFLFDAATGSLRQTFNNPTPADDDAFGFSVSISGNHVLVGTPNDRDDNAGSAYLFDAGTGSLLQTFNNPFPNPSDGFGWSVSLSENTVLVGAPFDGSIDPGSVYLFDSENGSFLREINNPGATSYSGYENFGISVGISGDNFVVAAPGYDSYYSNGYAYIYSYAAGTDQRCDIRSVLLGRSVGGPEDDLNHDGQIDIADLIAAPRP